ncbi:molecular chaperone [Proteus columbae]|uniref:fimbrial biogenesis chaperone n=1 Tax=Proteus columbae TaxID=1987580 RepID=UPI0018C7385E|nr:fimbria/pilus periplasmic chaperone [Proteus columbae]MBG6026242.1 fimbria/pilus periplasmic chaperone [Proteus mirabilis]MBG6047106.1 fimbria/pilus periplasmic chaperone [Proteus mirabilis]
MKTTKLIKSFFLSLLIIIPTWANAAVVISGTRVIYNESEKEVTLKVSNEGTVPVLIQNWIDTGDVDASPETIQVPFVLTPPVFRVEPTKSQTLRIGYIGGVSLPKNKETIYWLNVLEIPPTATGEENKLQIAYRSRIKLFYRPTALKDKIGPIEAAEGLKFSVSGNTLKVINNAPYYVSLVSISLNGNDKQPIDGELVPPLGSHDFAIPNGVSANTGNKVVYRYVNDWGAMKIVESKI